MQFHIPIKLPSLMNSRMHWRAVLRLKKSQRLATLLAMRGRPIPPFPLVVVIIRVGPRRLDDDNLAASCKYVRDQVAAACGVDDGSPLYTWRYEQRRGEYGVDVEIVTRK